MTPASATMPPGGNWQVDWKNVAALDRDAFDSAETLRQQPMEAVTRDRRSAVSRLTLKSNYYVKTFTGKGSRLKYWLGISRYQRELRNLGYFSELGLDTPALVASGHRTRLGLLQDAVLVTREVENAIDLDQLIHHGGLYREGVTAARAVLGKLARATRRLHDDGFYHKDLKPRNVLLRCGDGEPELFFFDCPSGHHPPRLLLHRSIVRDLAHLEDGLRGHIRRVDLLYMYKQYRACRKLSDEDKALAREALCYYSQRRMTRKRRRREEVKRTQAGKKARGQSKNAP